MCADDVSAGFNGVLTGDLSKDLDTVFFGDLAGVLTVVFFADIFSGDLAIDRRGASSLTKPVGV